MEPLVHQDSSPYINDPEFQSNSPSSVQINISPQHSPFDSFEFADIQNNNFPHTSSYNGSYHNSPYSGHSELSFGENDQPLNLFEEQANIDYDPSDYDAPNSSGLLMFDSSDYLGGMDQVSVSVIPVPDDHRSPHNFDYSSPSSNGGADSGPDGERSRASSVSSNHQQHASPRLDVAQSLENMTFRSPHWGTNPLPTDRPISPPQKAQSPPQLMIPDSGSPGPSYSQTPPIINAPSGDGGAIHGPSLNIVPATPITGGGSATTVVPYQQTMDSLRQGQVQNGQHSAPQGWNPQSQPMQHSDEGQTLEVAHFREQAQLSYSFPPQHSHNDVTRLSSSQVQMQSQTQYNNHSANDNTNDFLFPSTHSPRVRSKSDTSLHQWNASPFVQDRLPNDDYSAVDDNSGTVNMNDVLPTQQHPSSTGAHQTTFPHLSATRLNYGQPNFPQQLHSNDFLSPDMVTVRRAKSDGGSRGHRSSRSEDVRHSGTHLYPPISQQSAAQEYLRHPQFLLPQETLPPIHGRHMRRASSPRGSRADWSNPSSSRPSPYPSPHASPRVPYEDLPNDLSTVTLSGREQVERGLDAGQESDPGGTIVSKPNVTTGRTANASHKRRKQDANFKCPVPGCGSTFTRSFNLKGHLRSHNEEKPFLCKWPGCNKGFARQHDCKRHEQLHSNYRPFICEGCSKPFARMDALNRHLKSEGGADCVRLLAEAGRDLNQRAYRQPPPPPLSSMTLTKMEPDFGSLGVVL